MPVKLFGKRLPRLRPGDEVEGLLVKQVDPDRNTLIVSGHHLEVVSPVDQFHRHPAGRNLEEFEEGASVSGRLLHFAPNLGMFQVVALIPLLSL